MNDHYQLLWCIKVLVAGTVAAHKVTRSNVLELSFHIVDVACTQTMGVCTSLHTTYARADMFDYKSTSIHAHAQECAHTP
jgi:hypothetical protein